MKKDGPKTLEQLVIEHNAQARIACDVARQLEKLLPISSREEVEKQISELVIDNNRLPVKMFAAFVGDDLFPIKDLEDLVHKVSRGVRDAIGIGRSPGFSVTHPSARALLASTLHDEPGTRLATPIVFGGVGSPMNQTRKGGA